MVNSTDPNYCPVDPEELKSEDEKEVKSSTLILIMVVLVLLVASSALAYLILNQKKTGSEMVIITPTTVVATPTVTPVADSLQQVENQAAEIEVDEYSDEFREIDTLVDQL